MLWAIIAILFVLWIIGVALKFTAGGLLHLLLVIAVIMVIVRLIRGRSVV